MKTLLFFFHGLESFIIISVIISIYLTNFGNILHKRRIGLYKNYWWIFGTFLKEYFFYWNSSSIEYRLSKTGCLYLSVKEMGIKLKLFLVRVHLGWVSTRSKKYRLLKIHKKIIFSNMSQTISLNRMIFEI